VTFVDTPIPPVGEKGVPPAGEPEVVGLANGFVPVAAGMSGCAGAGCPNGVLFCGDVPVACGLANGFVFCCCGGGDWKGLGAPVAEGSIDCRKGFVDCGDIGERVDCGERAFWGENVVEAESCGMLERPGVKRCCCGCAAGV
jgi:hypothetical protein